jgi:hypothetical protein
MFMARTFPLTTEAPRTRSRAKQPDVKRQAAPGRLATLTKRVGEAALRASFGLDKIVGKVLERTGSLVKEHKAGVAYTLGGVATVAGVVLAAKGYLDYQAYEQMSNAFKNMMELDTSPVSTSNADTEMLSGAGVSATGLFTLFAGMVISDHQRDQRAFQPQAAPAEATSFVGEPVVQWTAADDQAVWHLLQEQPAAAPEFAAAA